MLWHCYKYSSILICFGILQGFIGFVLLFSSVNWPFWLVFLKCRVCSHNVRSPWGSVHFPSSDYLCEKGDGHYCKARRERRTSSRGIWMARVGMTKSIVSLEHIPCTFCMGIMMLHPIMKRQSLWHDTIFDIVEKCTQACILPPRNWIVFKDAWAKDLCKNCRGKDIWW